MLPLSQTYFCFLTPCIPEDSFYKDGLPHRPKPRFVFCRDFSYLCRNIMGRLLAIDFGRKRCGIAVTDALCIIANPLTTVRSCDLNSFIATYAQANPLDKIIVGLPTTMRG